MADPQATVRQLYRHIILGQTFGASPVSGDELRFILVHTREAFPADLRPVVDQMYAEHLLRPLESDCFQTGDPAIRLLISKQNRFIIFVQQCGTVTNRSTQRPAVP